MLYGTKAAIAGALITQDHECGCVVSETFQLVGAVRFLAHSLEVEVREQVVDFGHRGFEAEPPPKPFRLMLTVFRFHPLLPPGEIAFFPVNFFGDIINNFNEMVL